MSKFRVGFRVDASTSIGNGHVMRMLALMQGFEAFDVETLFFTNKDGKALLEWYFGTCGKVILVEHQSQYNAAYMEQLAKSHRLSLLVFDGYHFPPSYIESSVTNISCLSVLIDDNNDSLLANVNVLINPGLGAEQLKYNNAQIVLAGKKYSLLRREFDPVSMREKSRSNLITFGGTDPMSLTLSFIDYYKKNEPSYCADILIGPGLAARCDIENVCNGVNGLSALSPSKEMAQTLGKYHKVVTAAGSTLYECRAMQCMTLPVITADNQYRTAHAIPKVWNWPQPIDAISLSRTHIMDNINEFLMSVPEMVSTGIQFDTYGRERLAVELIRIAG